MVLVEMQKALRAYGEVLRLIKRLPKDTRPYYAKYARENFVNYRDVDASDSAAIDDLLNRTYTHSLWVLHKYSVDESAAEKLKQKRRNGSGQEPGKRPGNNGGSTTAGNQTQRNGKTKKKKKNDDNKQPEMGPTPSRTNSAAHAKVRREKLGERIAALQHLVSPYGKTDTASVLHEAMGYIRFLQDQVKVLSSPYLQCLPSSSPPHHLSEKEGEKWTGSITKGLRSRGLCLVPLQCLVDIDNSNGADFWSSAPSPTTPSKP